MDSLRPRHSPGSIADEAWFRLGAAIVGAAVGAMTAGLVLGPLLWTDALSASFARILMSGLVSGALVGAVLPRAAMAGLGGLLHFLYGALAVLLGTGDLDRPAATPGWLWVACLTGAVYAAGVALALIVLA